MTEPQRAMLMLDSWAGRREHKVWIVGETPKRYRVSPRGATIKFPRGRHVEVGQTTLVPKHAVRLDLARAAAPEQETTP